MRPALHHWWKAALLLCLLLQCGEAQVLAAAPAGPLYRAVGTPLSIYCNVSGFRNQESVKHFQFYVKKPAQPSLDINIVSTNDPSFGYAVYQARVRSSSIRVTRLSPNAVVFEIRSLEKEDEGEYECNVLNEEYIFYGTYNVKTAVKVIDNSLSVSSPDSAQLSFSEGEALTLTCQASSNTLQHTHLSLAWYLRKDGEDDARPIISLDGDFTLRSGLEFEGRYQAGLISLDKVGDSTYRLKMSGLEPSDQGRIHCQAQEWIQDPDHSWYPITRKDSEETTLKVKAREVKPDTSSLVVRLQAQQTTLQEGQELLLSCGVDALNQEGWGFSVAFLRGNVELVRIGPAGVLSVGPEYSGREREGELRATRTGSGDHRLILRPVRTEDRGVYKCRVWTQERGPDGAFAQGAAQDSNSQPVDISAAENGLSVKLRVTGGVTEQDGLELVCEVEGVKGQLSVTWQHKSASAPAALFTNIIGLSREGVMEATDEFRTRRVRATRPAANVFVFELDEVKLSDSGVYQCAVSEWKSNTKTHSQMQAATVKVTPLGMRVNLISRNNKAAVGDDVELICRVRGPHVPITLTWSLQREATTLDNILTVYSDGSISWFSNQHHYQLRAEKKDNGVIHYLQIIGASRREEGRYQCHVSAFVDNVHKRLQASNQVAVEVQNPESNLALWSRPTVTADINADINIVCSVTSRSSASSLYNVTWLHQHDGNNRTVASSGLDAAVAFGPQSEMSRPKRISLTRTGGPGFELTVRRATTADGGTYVCVVEEWLRDPRGDWCHISTESRASEITVVEPANDLRLDQTEQTLLAKEGTEAELQCDVVSGAAGPSFFYKVTWLRTVSGPPTRNASLVELDHTGLLSYPRDPGVGGLRERLRLSRPARGRFPLRIRAARGGDSGTYWCKVERYQLDQDGLWWQTASDSGGPVTLNISLAEPNLRVVKKEEELNISTFQDFTIPCHVESRSSNQSRLQVTWFWKKDPNSKQRSVFTVHQNFTLQDFLGESLNIRFVHPLPNLFAVTVLNPRPENAGLYFCEVEEWLPSLPGGWRKAAVKRSGALSVGVHSRAHSVPVSESDCNSLVWIVVIVVLLLVLIFVLVLLMLKICRSKMSGGKGNGRSLWTKQNPLKPTAGD